MSSALSPRKAACDHVYRSFPDMKGARPRMSKRGPHRVFTFQKTMRERGGPVLKQVVKVTVDDAGKVLKVVASR